MDTENTAQLLFYQKLGELFYAIAASDKSVRKEEYAALTKLVDKEWTTIDEYKDAFKRDAAYQISIVFEWFDYEQMDAEDCFESFCDYYKAHESLFTEKRKKLIQKTISKIASAFNDVNKGELIMLAKIQLLFKNE
ncbi:hypothetical protein SCB49_03589 [unidentified eubacterium SCB49]|nr:hypothetical protein SCB49_03589 [unidentified eubacterium SCB49]